MGPEPFHESQPLQHLGRPLSEGGGTMRHLREPYASILAIGFNQNWISQCIDSKIPIDDAQLGNRGMHPAGDVQHISQMLNPMGCKNQMGIGMLVKPVIEFCHGYAPHGPVIMHGTKHSPLMGIVQKVSTLSDTDNDGHHLDGSLP